jgi:dihydroflavonol-4-reductase
MRAVVIGASGHVGSAIVRALLQRQYDVTAGGRRPFPPINLAELPITYSPGDAEDPHQFDRWIAGQDLVVDAAAPYPIDIFSPVVNASSDYIVAAERRTRHLIEAATRYDATTIYIGSFVTIAKPGTPVQRIRAGLLRLSHPYFSVKELIDAQFVEAARRGLRVVIASPSYCLGPWDLRNPELCTIPMLLRRNIPAAITSMLNVIDVRDVADAALAAVDSERFGQPLLMSAYNISVRQLYSLICELGGVTSPNLPMSADLAVVAAYWAEAMLGLIDRKPKVPSAGMAMTTEFDYLDHECAIRDLGIEPRPLRETIWDAIQWYRKIGYC